jgi:geranylgeranyl pyrophosphate synthase
MAIFANTLTAICRGELRQLFDRHEVPHLDSEEAWEAVLDRYDQRIHAKTASLFAAATEGAAVLSGAPETHVTALRDYGRFLGMGFQIIDDVLDFRGEEELLGKPVGSDLREGIVTLPVLYYLRVHPDDKRVAEVVRDGRDDALVHEVVAAVRESGAVALAAERAQEFIIQSQEALSLLPEGRSRSIMLALADYTISRRE